MLRNQGSPNIFKRNSSYNETKKTENQVHSNILHLLVCIFGHSG